MYFIFMVIAVIARICMYTIFMTQAFPFIALDASVSLVECVEKVWW